MKHVTGKTFWGKAASAVGVAVAASGGVLAAVASGAHESTQSGGRGFTGGFRDRLARIDVATAAKDAAEFGDARVAPAGHAREPVSR